MPQNTATNERGYKDPARLTRQYWSTYFHIPTGKNYRQEGTGTTNRWVEITDGGGGSGPGVEVLNDLADVNTTPANGEVLIWDQATSQWISGPVPTPSAAYKVFIATINDFGGEPTMIILENTLSGTPILSESSPGNFKLTLAEEFTLGYTTTLLGPLQGPNYINKVGPPSADYVNWFTQASGQMLNMTIEIRVYPSE